MKKPNKPRRLLITPGEPAGIGPDLVVQLAQEPLRAELVAVCDPELLRARAKKLGLPLRTTQIDLDTAPRIAPASRIAVLPVKLRVKVYPGKLDARNSAYVLDTLRLATDTCLAGAADALVTGPVQKSIINEAGEPFSGHTEFLAERTGAAAPVMMLAAGSLRVALATTHLPLRAVPDAITPELLTRTLRVLDGDLRARFGIARPRILVCGLNPHAGESGHLGHEETDIIVPVLAKLRREGLDVRGPLPADTLFTARVLKDADAVLALYHDQGLPVLKHAGFGEAVNVTLGLPIVRTSVDHGTALELAGTGRADSGSLRAAIRMALELCGDRPT